MILVIDNYDSFTYNLVQALGGLGAELKVVRNDKITPKEAEALHPDRIIISPGPCTPREAGVSCDMITHFAGKCPILGVCLGHQSIGHAFGGEVVRADLPVHGKIAMITHDSTGIFSGMSNPFVATRYHSLIVKEDTLPDCLVATAHTEDGKILMGLRHRDHEIHGVQFHPESFLTEEGNIMLKNFLLI